MTTDQPKTAKAHNAALTGAIEKAVEDVKQPLKPNVTISEGGLGELLMKHKEDFRQPGTVSVIPAYELEISAIGVILRNLDPLPHETQTRILSYAMQWVDDQKGVKTDER